MVLKGLIFVNSYFLKDVVDMKGPILDDFHIGRCGGPEGTDFWIIG